MHDIVTTTLARSAFATLASFRHGHGPHRDPDEERFSRPTVIFTTLGRWRVTGSHGRVHADERTVVLGHADESYRCGHDEDRPTDRALFLTVDHRRLGYDPLPGQAATPLTPQLERLLGALSGAGDPLQTDALALELLLALRREWPGRLRRRPVEAARDLLDHSLERTVTLFELAAHVHVSPYHLHRRFREEYGIAPHEYLTQRRIERAQELLEEGASVTETAATVGYSSPGYFATVFRKRVGVSPSQYRRAGAAPRRAGAQRPR